MPEAKVTQQLTILVVDDSEMNRRLMCKFIEHLGHRTAVASNGLEAVHHCAARRPDVILMDVNMPVMDGFEATSKIRTLLGERWIPIIFLTALANTENLLQGLAVGGDDYLPKPVDLSLLKAKIAVLLRVAKMQQRIADDAVSLAKYYHANEQQQALAVHVLEHITAQTETAVSHIRKWINPAQHFSGDVICVARSPTGVEHILLADSTGHGLSAAISCIPAADSFCTLTQQGFSISAIARHINQKLNRVMPVGRFLAAALVAIDYRERVIAVWNGGIPCAFFLNRDGVVEKEFFSAYPPIGIVDDSEFEAGLDIFRWSKDGELIVASDGLIEAFDAQERPFDTDGVIDAARSAARGESGAAILQAVKRHLNGTPPHDDISLLIADCGDVPIEQADEIAAEPRALHTSIANWEIRLTFSAPQLREQDCFQALIGWLNQLALNAKQFSDILLILTELFNNALDHGLLNISSKLKSVEDGFQIFMEERARRLANLREGEIEVGMARDRQGEKALLRLWIKDSGLGFDHYAARAQVREDSELQAYGRGMPLIAKITSDMQYLGNGNHVLVEYPL